MTLTQQIIIVAALAFSISSCHSFTTSSSITPSSRTIPSLVQTFATVENTASVGNLHGQSACFLPILQNDDEYIAPRIVQVCVWYYLNMVIRMCLILFIRGVLRWCHVIVNRENKTIRWRSEMKYNCWERRKLFDDNLFLCVVLSVYWIRFIICTCHM